MQQWWSLMPTHDHQWSPMTITDNTQWSPMMPTHLSEPPSKPDPPVPVPEAPCPVMWLITASTITLWSSLWWWLAGQITKDHHLMIKMIMTVRSVWLLIKRRGYWHHSSSVAALNHRFKLASVSRSAKRKFFKWFLKQWNQRCKKI